MADPTLKSRVLQHAQELGFGCAGIAPAEALGGQDYFAQFIGQGFHADMDWLARDWPRRLEPKNLLPGAHSVICLGMSYAPGPEGPCPDNGCHGQAAVGPGHALTPEGGQVALYARGKDYHRLLKNRCRKLLAGLSDVAPGITAKICVDIAPISDRALAHRAGLGWIGRNGCLLNRTHGSYLLLAEIVTDLELPCDSPQVSHCGHCRRCIDACPTAALGEQGLVDCRRCLSYLTIEHRRTIPPDLRPYVRQLFGCDLCQGACPWNRRAKAGQSELVSPSVLANVGPRDVLSWSEGDWDVLTRGSSARRATYEVWLRNAALVVGNARDAACRPALERLAKSSLPVAAEAAAWALERI